MVCSTKESHSHAEIILCRMEIVQWVSESIWPFNIVKDRGFHSLMKTGQPEFYIPSPETVSHDVKKAFIRCCQRIVTMLQVGNKCVNMILELNIVNLLQGYDGALNFATDAQSLCLHYSPLWAGRWQCHILDWTLLLHLQGFSITSVLQIRLAFKQITMNIN